MQRGTNKEVASALAALLYLERFFAFFGLDFFTCGAGGVDSMRRRTSSSFGCGAGLGLRSSMEGA